MFYFIGLLLYVFKKNVCLYEIILIRVFYYKINCKKNTIINYIVRNKQYINETIIRYYYVQDGDDTESIVDEEFPSFFFVTTLCCP